jgi:anti-anti-sigma factor
VASAVATDGDDNASRSEDAVTEHTPGTLYVEPTGAGPVVVSLLGEHDLNTCPQVRETLEGLAAERKPLVIDLTKTTFVDSSILHALVRVRQECACHQKACVLQFGTTDVVQRVLAVSGILELFDHRPGREDAVRLAAELR